MLQKGSGPKQSGTKYCTNTQLGISISTIAWGMNEQCNEGRPLDTDSNAQSDCQFVGVMMSS